MKRVYWRDVKNPKVILVKVLWLTMAVFLLALLRLDGSVFATINPSNYTLNVSLQNQNQSIEYTPLTWDSDKYVGAMRTMTVSTNSPSGYRVYVDVPTSEASAGSLLLVGGSSSSPSIAPINTTPSTANTLSSDTWGFGIPSGTSYLPTNNFSNAYSADSPAVNGNYAGVKVSPNSTLIRNVTGTVSGNDSFNIYYGMRLGTDVMTNPGTYRTNISYHVTSEASDVVGGEATITPTSGVKAGGETVTITTSLMIDYVPSGVSVTIGGNTCTSPSSSVSTGVLVVTCTTAAHYPEPTDVVVNISSLGITYTINDGYEYIETGDVKITGISYVSGINVNGTPNPSIDSTTGEINFDLTFLGGLDNTDTLQATYRLTVTNSTDDDYTFTAPSSNLTLRISPTEVRDITYELSGIAVGDTIPANSSVSFNIILNTDYVSGEHSAEGGVDVEPVNQANPSIIGSINGSNTGDLSGSHTITSFQINVENTFEETKTFTINSLNSDFVIVNSSGNALGPQTIGAETTGTYTFYMKKTNGAAFASETATAGITISYDSAYTNVGEVNIKVDKDPSYIDSQAPTISSVVITKNKTTVGEATLTWSGTDNVGVASYGIYACTSNGCGNMISVSGLTTSYKFTGLSDNSSYYFVVVGFDDEGNTATQSQISGANTDPGPASSTGEKELIWHYGVTARITNGSISNTSASVAAGGSWEGTFSPNSGRTTPAKNNITVKVDGQTITNFDYSGGKITINNVSGPIEISADCPDSGCLLEGTLIALADGTTKPIEDISYRDILKVWNYETGNVGAEHPGRIETVTISNNYQLIKFSDGTELKVVGWHGIFDIDANEYISVDNPDRFYPGLRVYKVENDQLVPVTVISSEMVVEDVTAYHIISNHYYNIIANNILTTDGTVMTSNRYGFEGTIKWPAIRNEFISDPNNLYTYLDFVDIGMPRRMFDDLNIAEASYLKFKYGVTLDMFKDYLVSNRFVEDMVPYDDE